MTAFPSMWQEDAHAAAHTPRSHTTAARNDGVRQALWFITQHHRYNRDPQPELDELAQDLIVDTAYETLCLAVERQARYAGIPGVKLPHREELHP